MIIFHLGAFESTHIQYSCIAVDDQGRFFVTDCGNHRVKVFTVDGTLLTQWGHHGTGDGQLDCPFGIAVDRHGRVFVTELGNRRVQAFTAEGAFLTKWGSAGAGDNQFRLPYGIAVDGAGRVLVTSDYGYPRSVTSIPLDGKSASMLGKEQNGSREVIACPVAMPYW